MVNYTYINNQAKFIKPDAFYKQTSFNLATFGRHEGDFREKKSMFQWILDSGSVSWRLWKWKVKVLVVQ